MLSPDNNNNDVTDNIQLLRDRASGGTPVLLSAQLAKQIADQLEALQAEYQKNFRLLCETEERLAGELRRGR